MLVAVAQFFDAPLARGARHFPPQRRIVLEQSRAVPVVRVIRAVKAGHAVRDEIFEMMPAAFRHERDRARERGLDRCAPPSFPKIAG